LSPLLHSGEADAREGRKSWQLREELARCEEDPTMKARMDRVKALHEELKNL